MGRRRSHTRELGSRMLILGLLTSLTAGLVPASEGDPTSEVLEAVTRFGTALPGLLTDLAVAPGRETEAVVLTGADVASWAAPAEVTLHVPDLGGLRCQGSVEFFGDTPITPDEGCTSNRYEDPTLSTQDLLDAEGTPIDRLLAYRWNGSGFEQIPFQVDEVFPRYLSNNRSGFSFYSNTDEHTSYAFDREGFRWTGSHPEDQCLAVPESDVATDPVPGLDTADELVFMARDAGPQAPGAAELPAGILDAYEVRVVDPYDPTGAAFVYLARADEGGPEPAFDASNGYVRYERDEDADVFLYSQSSYSNYGAAFHGPYYDPATGRCITDESEWRQRRPADTATVTTPRYRFRYDGRWLMTEIAVSDDEEGDWTYGRNLVDRWKARAFQQRPGGTTPCCGYEEEENNWGGSSQLLGERAGPVRVIRETWGADSGTNVVRREVFYRDEIEQTTFLRVHVIPPIDGIYAQWDHAAGAVTTYYNPFVPDGVPIDGKNDEVFGNHRLHVGLDGISIDGDDSTMDLIRDLNGGTPLTIGTPNEPACRPPDPIGDLWDGWRDVCIYNDVDTPDPLFSGVNALLAWEQIAGPHGTIVSRWSADLGDLTPGGLLHAAAAVPYYRDDACFDDGTGSDPGPHLNRRAEDTGQFATWIDADGVERPRECWDADRHENDPEYASYLGTDRFWQGSIGTHGMHLLLIADSDNLNLTKPLTEIVATQRMVVLEPTLENVGASYGNRFEKPLLTFALPYTGGGGADEPSPEATTLSLDAPEGGEHGDQIEVTVTLTSDDEPVADREISIDLGTTEATVTTDSAGSATTELVLEDLPGEHEVRASFAGDDDFEGSSAAAPFTIHHRTTALTFVGDNGGRGKQLDAAARLTDRHGTPIEGAEVRFAIEGEPHVSATTDSDGVASSSLRVTGQARNSELTARFDGDQRHAPSETSRTIAWRGGAGETGQRSGPPGASESRRATATGAPAEPGQKSSGHVEAADGPIATVSARATAPRGGAGLLGAVALLLTLGAWNRERVLRRHV